MNVSAQCWVCRRLIKQKMAIGLLWYFPSRVPYASVPGHPLHLHCALLFCRRVLRSLAVALSTVVNGDMAQHVVAPDGVCAWGSEAINDPPTKADLLLTGENGLFSYQYPILILSVNLHLQCVISVLETPGGPELLILKGGGT